MLEIEGVTKTFGSLTAVDGLSMRVEAGAIHGLIGPNGSGKSTVMNLIGGTHVPTAGSICFEGRPIGGLKPHEIARRGVIRTSQLTRVFAEGSVFEAVRMGAMAASGNPWNPARWRPLRRDGPASEAAWRALAATGLEQLADRPAGTLPGGLQRTLSIATALAAKPKLLLLDEPLAGLNASEKAEVAGRIEGLHAAGIAILLVEHDVRSVMRLCGEITVVNFGRRIASGTPEAIGTNDTVIEAYLGRRRGSHADG